MRRRRKSRPIKSDSCGEPCLIGLILVGGWLHMVATSVGWTA